MNLIETSRRTPAVGFSALLETQKLFVRMINDDIRRSKSCILSENMSGGLVNVPDAHICI